MKIFKKITKWFKDDFFTKLLKNVVTLITGNVGASALGYVSLLISIKVLGITGFGLLTIMQTYVRIFNGLLNFQSWEAIIRYGSEALARNDEKALKSHIKQGFILDLGSAIIGTATALVLASFFGKLYNWDENIIKLTRLFCVLILFNLSGTPTGILRLYGKFKTFSFQKIISAIIKLIGVTIAFFIKGDLELFILIIIFTELSGYFILVFVGYKTFFDKANKNVKVKGFIQGKDFLKFTLLTNINSTLSLPMKEFDKIIASLISLEAVGIYRLIKQLVNIIGKIVTPVYQAIYPELSRFISEKNYKKAVSVSKKIGVIMFGVGFVFFVILAPTSPIWLKLITGIDSNFYCIILSLFLFQKVLANLFICVNSLFISTGYIKYNFPISLIGSILYGAIAYWGTLKIGLLGLLIASFIQMFWANGTKIIILSRDSRLYS